MQRPLTMGPVIVTARRLGRDRASDDVFPFKRAVQGRAVNTNDEEHFVPRRDAWYRARVSAAGTEASSTPPGRNVGQRSRRQGRWYRSFIRYDAVVGYLPSVAKGGEESGDGTHALVVELRVLALSDSVRCPHRLQPIGRAGARMARETSDGVAVAKLERDRPCRRCP